MRRKAPRYALESPPSSRASPATPRTPVALRVVVIVSDRRRAHRRSPFRRTLDGADVHAKRRRTDTTAGDAMPDGPEKRNTIADESDLADAAPLDDAELDVSLERYEYAATSSILAGTGGVGFAATCAFNREKSATKELLELLRPHVRWCDDADADDGADDGDAAARRRVIRANKKTADAARSPPRLRLNPVKMPGRGFVFVRLSVAKGQAQGENAREKQPLSRGDALAQVAPGATGATGSPSNEPANEPVKSLPTTDDVRVARSLGRAVARAAAALTASVRAGTVPAPRWVEKVAIQATCAMPDADGGLDLDRDGRLAETMGRVVAGLDVAGSDDVAAKTSGTPSRSRTGSKAATRATQKRARRTNGTRAKRWFPRVAAAAATAPPGAATADLRDPDVTLSRRCSPSPREARTDPEAGGFVERLAIGAAAKRDGVFELKRGATAGRSRSSALERGVVSDITYRFENSHRRSLAVRDWFAVNNTRTRLRLELLPQSVLEAPSVPSVRTARGMSDPAAPAEPAEDGAPAPSFGRRRGPRGACARDGTRGRNDGGCPESDRSRAEDRGERGRGRDSAASPSPAADADAAAESPEEDTEAPVADAAVEEETDDADATAGAGDDPATTADGDPGEDDGDPADAPSARARTLASPETETTDAETDAGGDVEADPLETGETGDAEEADPPRRRRGARRGGLRRLRLGEESDLSLRRSLRRLSRTATTGLFFSPLASRRIEGFDDDFRSIASSDDDAAVEGLRARSSRGGPRGIRGPGRAA